MFFASKVFCRNTEWFCFVILTFCLYIIPHVSYILGCVSHSVYQAHFGCPLWGTCREKKTFSFVYAIEPGRTHTTEADCSTSIDEIHTWFTPGTEKWPTKGAVERGANIMAACHMTCCWACSLWVMCWGGRRSWSIEHVCYVYQMWLPEGLENRSTLFRYRKPWTFLNMLPRYWESFGVCAA